MTQHLKSLLILSAACLLIGFLTGYFCARSKKETVRVERVVVRDTIVQEKPVYVAKKVVDSIKVSVPTIVHTSDTTYIRDTVYLNLPREEKIYENDDYRAVVSGYMPSLDAMTIYKQTEVVTNTRIQKQHWTFGIGITFGCYYGIRSRTIDGGPGLGLTFGYQF